MEGYLLKRKSKGGFGALGYCKRYFVLNNISLLYSNSSDDTEVSKIIVSQCDGKLFKSVAYPTCHRFSVGK